ncbi:glycosyltransferase family 2 protein [Vibrio sp. 03-59-1]|uniref:glycosyltransferase family 2 protein n=1 Tax=Vibrio sp. 03-59-1 TaxID=2607607 RepID=UPI001493750B|nr:glycosyltransferase family 2 protein [Vibrio sp. 03-59-1]NOH84538.1 glycosyltransferase family 2 protein [Vibrio sp. 03-59-1]
MKKAIVIPAFNEELSIRLVLNSLLEHTTIDIVVVDDASSDHTATIVKEDSNVILLSLASNLGAWKAMQTGIRYCYNNGYDKVITFDADGQHLPSSLPILSAEIAQTNHDVVIGSCTQRGSMARHIAWRLFRILSGIRVQDLTSGLRIYNRAAMAVLSTREASLLEYQDVGVLLMLKTFGLTFSEVQVEMNSRVGGISRIFYSWRAVAYYMVHTSLLCISKVRKSNELQYQTRLSKQGRNH